MARWRALPDELDPRAAELVVHMRRCVDRAGLTLTVLAERTGYSHTSWERFLDARLLAPRRAIDALAETTDTSPVHLTTLWELAEHAWNHPQSTPGDRATTQLRVPPAALPAREVGGPTEGNSWGLAGYKGPSRAGGSAAAAASVWVAPAGGGGGS
ncbi:helix-turn-helix domain-containing protein, partial [Streptomyces sp. S6]